MNTNSFRREVLIGVGGFVVGMALSLAMFSWRPSGVPMLQAESRGSGWNHVVTLNPTQSEFIALPQPAAVSIGMPVLSFKLRAHTPTKPAGQVLAPPVISILSQHPYHLIDLRPVDIQPKN